MELKKYSEKELSLWNIEISYSRRFSIMIAIFGAVAFIGWSYFFKTILPDCYDPIWLRLITILPFSLMLITPRKKSIKWLGDGVIITAAGLAAMAHGLYLWTQNNYSIYFGTGLSIIFAISLILSTSLRNFTILSASILIPFLANTLFAEPRHEIYMLFISCVTLSLAMAFTLTTKLRTTQSLMQKQNELFAQFESLKLAHKHLVTEKVKNINSSRLTAIGEMAAGVAHEVNNPLTILKGYLTKIRSHNLQSEYEKGALIEDISQMNKTLDRIAHVVRSLINIADVKTEKPQEVVSVKSIVNISCGFFHERFKHHKINLMIDLNTTDYQVFGYASQLSQCLVNLISNAFDAARESEKKWVRVSVEHEEDRVKIYVVDSGSGISADRISQVFDPFYTTKLYRKASGLGLSVSKSMAENVGGSLEYVENCLNTTFVLSLPEHKAELKPFSEFKKAI